MRPGFTLPLPSTAFNSEEEIEEKEERQKGRTRKIVCEKESFPYILHSGKISTTRLALFIYHIELNICTQRDMYKPTSMPRFNSFQQVHKPKLSLNRIRGLPNTLVRYCI